MKKAANDLDNSNYHQHIELSKPSRFVKEAISILKNLIAEKPKMILASIKLWQLYRLLSQQSGESLAQRPVSEFSKQDKVSFQNFDQLNQIDYFGVIRGHYDSEENKEMAMRVAETMHRNYYNLPDDDDFEDLQKSQRLKEAGADIEKQMLITLVNVKSLYDIGSYRDCFEML